MRSFDIALARETANSAFRAILDREADAMALRHYSALLVKKELSIREMIRQLACSDEFLENHVSSRLPVEAAHGIFRRFLGRSAESELEAKGLAVRILKHGLDSQISSILNSGEYLKKYGDDEVPL